jgi:hypothetical protein
MRFSGYGVEKKRRPHTAAMEKTHEIAAPKKISMPKKLQA